MMERPHRDVPAFVEELYRAESRRVFATLIRLTGDFDLAEEAVQEAFAAAIDQWPREGVPSNPRAWLVSTGRFKAIDVQRRRARFETAVPELMHHADRTAAAEDFDEARFNDDHLRLIFTCCHPVLPQSTQVAMTLREVCGLTTDAIARAFLTGTPTIAQRIVRGKSKIRDANLPFEVPAPEDLPQRLDAVLAVIYLVFNEGYLASSGDALTRPDLSAEAIRLGRILVMLLPEPEVQGLLALMLLHESRRPARVDAHGDLVLLEDQDRTRWDRASIEEGQHLVAEALASRRFGAYTIQAAIAAVHARASSATDTAWPEIVAYYDLLMRITASPVVALNRAVAVAMRDGPDAGLAEVDAIGARGDLEQYYLAHAVRADLLRRVGRTTEALTSYRRALALVQQEPERRFLERRLRELGHDA